MKEGKLEKNIPERRPMKGEIAGRREWQKVPKRPPTEEGKPKRFDEFLPVEEIPEEEREFKISDIIDILPKRIKEKLAVIIKERRQENLSEDEKEQLREEIIESLYEPYLGDVDEEDKEDTEQKWENYEPTSEEIESFFKKEKIFRTEEKEKFPSVKELEQKRKQKILKDTYDIGRSGYNWRGRKKRTDKLTKETVRRKKPNED